jgi:hypothetical protein
LVVKDLNKALNVIHGEIFGVARKSILLFWTWTGWWNFD